MKMLKKHVKMELRNSSTDQGQRMVRSSLIAIDFLAIFGEMWFLTTDPESFPRERTAGVCSRGKTVTNKSNSLTFSVTSSLVCTSPLAVITVVGPLDVLMVTTRRTSYERKSYSRHSDKYA